MKALAPEGIFQGLHILFGQKGEELIDFLLIELLLDEVDIDDVSEVGFEYLIGQIDDIIFIEDVDLHTVDHHIFLSLHGMQLLMMQSIGEDFNFGFEGLLDVRVDSRAVVEVLGLVEQMRHYYCFCDYKFIFQVRHQKCSSEGRETQPQPPIFIGLTLQQQIIILQQLIITMMQTLLKSTRFLFGKFKQPDHELGFLGQEPDLKGKELDKFRRYFTKVHLQHAGKVMPNFEAHPDDLPTLERNEIETRILRVLRDLEIVELRSVKFDADLRRDLKIDSLNIVALLTSIEHEFTTVFEDNVFQGIKNLNEVTTLLMRDPKII